MIGGKQNSFLLNLHGQLASGLQDLEAERAARHARRILSFQRPEGGFAGRQGESDLYYTSFALRGLALLNAIEGRRCRLVTDYLKSAASKKRYSLIDLVSWFYSLITVRVAERESGGDATEMAVEQTDGLPDDLPDDLEDALETYRRPDGGYARTHQGGSSSTYHTFLAVLCYEMLGRTPPAAELIVHFLLSRRREDGGFVEIGPMRRSGTNPTAAAAILLNRFQALEGSVLRGIADYLELVKGSEGGFRANRQIPYCDLLSSFTGMLMASHLGLTEVIGGEACRRYLGSLELDGGGFRGAAWDSETDPEYTFYGLGAFALLNLHNF